MSNVEHPISNVEGGEGMSKEAVSRNDKVRRKQVENSVIIA